jgi:hypothetical protein
VAANPQAYKGGRTSSYYYIYVLILLCKSNIWVLELDALVLVCESNIYVLILTICRGLVVCARKQRSQDSVRTCVHACMTACVCGA